MGSQTDKLYRIMAPFQIQAIQFERSDSFGRGQVVRLDLDEVIGTVEETAGGKKQSRQVKLREYIREGCLEEVEAVAEPMINEPPPELELSDEEETEGD